MLDLNARMCRKRFALICCSKIVKDSEKQELYFLLHTGKYRVIPNLPLTDAVIYLCCLFPLKLSCDKFIILYVISRSTVRLMFYLLSKNTVLLYKLCYLTQMEIAKQRMFQFSHSPVESSVYIEVILQFI